MLLQNPSRGKPLHEYAALKPGGTVLSHYGLDSSQFNAICAVTDDTVLVPSGKFLLVINTRTGEMESLEGPAGGAMGAAAVHPSRDFFIVGERSPETAQLLVYAWPSRELVGQFTGDGCSVGYAACCFDRAGTRVATVAAAPDYTLAVWDWETRTMVLRSKAFSTDVYTVRFSAFNNSLLVTGGSGHVKFWVTADTFTGMKLQGTLGKFGRLEISNVTGFAMLSDAKVLSGTESGCLLLWEGDLVKCRFVRRLSGEHHDPCHDGAIHAVELVHDSKTVVTFGADGWIRYWSRSELDQAEGDGVPPTYAPHCLAEVLAVPCAELRSVTLDPSGTRWVMLTSTGAITTSRLLSLEECSADAGRGDRTVTTAQPSYPPLLFNGGGITCCAASPVAHLVVTGGEDGVVRLVDYLTGSELTSIHWPRGLEGDSAPGERTAAVTSVAFLKTDASHAHLVVGFGDGTVRLLELSTSGHPSRPTHRFEPHGQWKPHASNLFAIALDAAERNLCTVARDGTAFFFTVDRSFRELAPVGFCRLPISSPTCADWDEAGVGCLVGFASGEVLSIRAPTLSDVTPEVSFEFSCQYTLLGIRQRRVPPLTLEDNSDELEEDILEVKDEGPWPVTVLRTMADGSLVIGCAKEELLYCYHGTVRYPGALSLPPLPPTGVEPPDYVEDPGENLCYLGLVPQDAFISPSCRELLVVCRGAQVVVRESASPEGLCSAFAAVSLLACAHDSTAGNVTGAMASFDGALVITTGTDGLIVTQVRPGHAQPEVAATAPVTLAAAAEIVAAAPPRPPTAEPPALSIQEQKEADDEAKAAAVRAEKRGEFLTRAFELQERHVALAAANAALPATARVAPDEMRLDATLETKLAAERKRRVTDARQEYAVDSAREHLRTTKLRNRFIDTLLHDRFLVNAFRGGFSVASFRTADSSTAITQLQANISSLEASDGSESEDVEEEGKVEMEGVLQRPARAGMREPVTGTSDRRAGRGAAGFDDGPPPTAEEDQQPATDGTAVSADFAPAASASRSTAPAASSVKFKSTTSTTVKQRLQRADERHEERSERRNGYAALLATAPDPLEDDALLARLEKTDLAERGECVMRTDPKYKGHRDFRPTATGKLRRMIALETFLVTKRSEFNERLLAMRDRKREVLEALNGIGARIRELDDGSGERGARAEPLAMSEEEEPEKALKVDRAGLDAFAKRKTMDKLREEEAKKAQRGFGADLAEAPQATRNPSMSMSKSALDRDTSASSRRNTAGARADSRSKGGSRTHSKLSRGSRASTVFLSAANRDRLEVEMRAKLENIKLSQLEDEELAMRREQLTSERRRLVAQADDVMHRFDDELYELFSQHSSVDADLCLGDAHLVLLFREYKMLLVFRNRDGDLRRKLHAAKEGRAATDRAIQSLQQQLKDNDAVLAGLQDRLKAHRRDAEAYIQEVAPADRAAYLLKIFNRHIKRRKHADDEEDNDDITSDDEDDELGDYDDIGEELCPPNCDVAVWERVLALREIRLDISDEITDTRRGHDEEQKRLEQSRTALDAYVASVKESLARIEELGHEKRRQLNMLSTVVPLRCSQVKCLEEDGTVPAALWDKSVVTLSDAELSRLSSRIVELAVQKVDRRGEIAGMTAELQRLQVEKAEVHKVHAHWQAQVHEVMMLKFGRLVDLEMLESCGTSHRIESKRDELRQTEMMWDREVRKQENRIAALRDELQKNLLRNTHILQDLGDHEGDRQAAERALAKASASAVDKFHGSRLASKADRENLRELVAAQQEEMDALNAEIVMLNRKGGHAYSPAATY